MKAGCFAPTALHSFPFTDSIIYLSPLSLDWDYVGILKIVAKPCIGCSPAFIKYRFHYTINPKATSSDLAKKSIIQGVSLRCS